MKRSFAPLAAMALAVYLSPTGALAEGKIGALGTIVPESGITVLTGGDIIEKILVKPGDDVKAGATLFVFRSAPSANAAADHARSELALARSDAARTVHLQDLKVKQAELDLGLAKERLENLGKMGADSVSPQLVEQRRYQVTVADMTLDAAKTQLEQAMADTAGQVESAENALAQANAKLAESTLVSPAAGTILEVSGHVGEPAGGQALVRIANLSAMAVSADVFASDILRAAPGQKAVISSPSLPGDIAGTVVSVGRLITGRSKIAQVLIHLSDPSVAARMIGLEVNVSIEP
jgi:HlyD family secretion protein